MSFFSFVQTFVSEIKQQRHLYYATGALLFYTFISFYDWSYSPVLTKTAMEAGAHLCWPYFQNCDVLYWFNKPPYGYGVNVFFMLVFALWAATVYFWVYKQYRWLWWGIFALFVVKVFVAYVYTYATTASYDFYHTFFLASLLFARGRWFFLSVFLALCYLFSATLKIYPDWFAGHSFDSVGGVPLFDLFIPRDWSALGLFLCFTLLPALLFVRNLWLRAFALITFLLFHWYTVAVVGFHYPALLIPLLWALWYDPWPKQPSFSKNLVGWGLIAFATLLQMWSFIVPGNEKVTGEGVRYGLYMFDANRDCRSMVRETMSDAFPWQDMSNTMSHFRSCYVYTELSAIKNTFCYQNPDVPIEWKLDFRNNLRDDYTTIVDVPNACALEWHPFWDNEWIDAPAFQKPWWWYWVWAFWGLNVALFFWLVIRLR